MKPELTIIKIGGQLIEEAPRLSQLLQDFAQIKGPKILVHGGGRRANQLCQQLGITPRMLNGRRLTDAPTLEIVTMVYAGLINKTIVAQLQAAQCNALGLTGSDLNCIRAHQRQHETIDYGFAGDVDEINDGSIKTLLEKNISPVFCAITHNGQGQLLNTNADTIAAQLAIAMTPHYKVRLKFCFELPGVMLDPKVDQSLIEELSHPLYQQYVQEQVIIGGMLPKLDNAFDALKSNVAEVFICSNEAVLIDGGTQLVLN